MTAVVGVTIPVLAFLLPEFHADFTCSGTVDGDNDPAEMGRGPGLRPGGERLLRPAMVLVVRNGSIATAVAVTVLGRNEFAVFAAAYFLNQVPIGVVALALVRLT